MPRWSSEEVAADRRLVQGLNEGDDVALGELYEEYAPHLYDYVSSVTGDVKVTADIVHDTFIDAYRRAPRMRDHVHLSSWLFGAARRRCVQRGRTGELWWDRDAEFAGHDLLRATLARMEFADQEAALLAFRHRLRPSRLGAALGVSSRRAALRVRRARTSLEEAHRAELEQAARECAGLRAAEPEPAAKARSFRSAAVVMLAARAPERRAPEPAAPPIEDEDVRRHVGDCADCRERARPGAVELLASAPAPVLPAALRHRVMHTATDPELAGHRADIAARGGALTPEGLPSQPDVPSPFTKRWLFTGGGMAGALVTALLATVVMGTGLGPSTLRWPPFGTRPQPSVTDRSSPGGPDHGTRPPQAQAPGGRPGAAGAPPAVRPQTDGREPRVPSPGPGPTTPAPTTPPPVPPTVPGELLVSPGKITMYGTKVAHIRLAAQKGPVTWTAMSSTGQIVLDRMQGGMAKGASDEVTVTLRTALIGLPGEGKVTITDSEGAAHQITIAWGVSLL
ncbi:MULTISPECIES: RNA polymerase sigma factor [Actinomadura]|uniref:Sigma factor n=1 Tax=Actinomadura yumaensis TaxID=111807 RepID=A0ABW2CSQ5_9ACTN|nr:sigma-70 family RNA polymerase sigma factor [Actinomadura sp. J1-007]MWK35104.1 RNA polymerase sigma factor [Actinomadura sp. J1-007]